MTAASNTRPTQPKLDLVGTFPENAGRIAHDDHVGWHVLRDQAAGANYCIFANCNPPEQSRPRTDSGTALNRGALAIPVGVSFQRAVSRGCSWVAVINKNNTVTEKNV